MSKKSKITFENLMARAEQRKNVKPTVATFNSKVLGGELELVKLPLTEYLDMLDEVSDASSLQENLDFSKKLIYKHCKILQNKELRDAYDCSEPYDIVTKVFDENMGEIGDCVNVINALYGIDEDAVKN